MPALNLPALLALISATLLCIAAAPSCQRKASENTEAPASHPTGTRPKPGEATPIPATENPPVGRSEPRAGEAGAGQSSETTPSPPARWSTYVDRTWGFQIDYPQGFVVRAQDVSKLRQFTPAPLASLFFMNATMAGGELAGIEPPDLEVRVYQAKAAESLERWLVSADFASGDVIAAARAFRTAGVSGLEICQSTMVAPGCSVYILRNSRVYQLTPGSRDGETMIQTFRFQPSS